MSAISAPRPMQAPQLVLSSSAEQTLGPPPDVTTDPSGQPDSTPQPDTTGTASDPLFQPVPSPQPGGGFQPDTGAQPMPQPTGVFQPDAGAQPADQPVGPSQPNASSQPAPPETFDSDLTALRTSWASLSLSTEAILKLLNNTKGDSGTLSAKLLIEQNNRSSRFYNASLMSSDQKLARFMSVSDGLSIGPPDAPDTIASLEAFARDSTKLSGFLIALGCTYNFSSTPDLTSGQRGALNLRLLRVAIGLPAVPITFRTDLLL